MDKEKLLECVLQRHPGIDEVIDAAKGPSHMGWFMASGDCLEGAGIVDGGFVLIDFSRRPAPPRYRGKGGDGSYDICLCYAGFGTDTPSIMLKEYVGMWGPWIMVGTRYSPEKYPGRMNYSLRAKAILGVVIASFDRDSNLMWQRDPDSFPEELDRTQTIHGDNIEPPSLLHLNTVGAKKGGDYGL